MITQPSNGQRALGFSIAIISALGLLITLPVTIISGFISLIDAALFRKNLSNSFKEGINLGSFGLIKSFNYGLSLTQPTETSADPSSITIDDIGLVKDSPPNIPEVDSAEGFKTPLQTTGSASSDAAAIAPAISASQSSIGKHRKVETYNFDNPEDFRKFQLVIEEYIAQEAKDTIIVKDESSVQVQEPYILNLIKILKDVYSAPGEFWPRLKLMSYRDVQAFVQKLNIAKEDINSMCELDYLWKLFQFVELSPSINAERGDQFALMLSCLSEEQLKASLQSPTFLSLLSQIHYVQAVAKTLNPKQFALFVADSSRHKALKDVILKIPHYSYPLSKLLSIVPLSNDALIVNLRKSISHLNVKYSVSFKTELIKLADYYLRKNKAASATSSQAPAAGGLFKSKSTPIRPAKTWPKVNPGLTRVYASVELVAKKECTDEEFAGFIRRLNATDFFTEQPKLVEDLLYLPDERIKMLIEYAALPEYPNLLKHMGIIESQEIDSGTAAFNKVHRLRIVLTHLSETQFLQWVKVNSFWIIFSNITAPYHKLVFEVFTPPQLTIFIQHLPIDKHMDLADFILRIPMDTDSEKAKALLIMQTFVPHTSPWFAFALERKIKSFDKKPTRELLISELKKALHLSLQNPEIKERYEADEKLDKNLLSVLLKEHNHLSHAATCRF